MVQSKIKVNLNERMEDESRLSTGNNARNKFSACLILLFKFVEGKHRKVLIDIKWLSR